MNMTRKEAIGRIQEHIHIHSKKEPFTPYLDKAFYMAIEALRQERPHGEWVRNDNGTYSCSICQSWIPNEQHHYARFCLYCGSDNRKREGEEK